MHRAGLLRTIAYVGRLQIPPRAYSLLFPHRMLVRDKHTSSKRNKGHLPAHRLPSINLSAPEQLYSKARAMKRRLVCHVGPTNSGKTFRALEALRTAKSGVYLGPLRLLAWEVSEKLNEIGVACNLVTGQELLEVTGANHVSCTVEMANLSQLFDVAVIDEAQLIGDNKRGWAWTRALLGLQAQEIHICGSPSFLDLVTKLAKRLGDTVEVFEYDRLTPLQPRDAPLKSYKRLKAGDCVIAFSRRSCYQLKQRIEKLHNGRYKCCVVYGGLPPAARQEQARLFNTQNSGFDILVATDAVGMGLNLSIGRIIFSSLDKFDGQKTRALRPDEIKQIAGRAGRYQSIYPNGEAVCLRDEDTHSLMRGLRVKDKLISSAGLFPSIDELRLLEAFVKFRMDDGMLEAFSDWMGTSDLASIEDLHDCIEDFMDAHPKQAARWKQVRARKLRGNVFEEDDDGAVPMSVLFRLFAELALLDGSGLYHLCDLEEVIKVAKMIDDVPFTFEDRYQWCMAPINTDDKMVKRHFLRFAFKYANDDNIPVGFSLPDGIPKNHDELLELESRFQVFDLYTWLANRYPAHFDERERAMELRQQCSEIIAAALMKLGPKAAQPQGRTGRQHIATPAGEGYEGHSEEEHDHEEGTRDDDFAMESKQRRGDKHKPRGKSKRIQRDQQVNNILRELAAL